MSYAKANLFVGKYRRPRGGHIKLPDNTTVRFLRGITCDDGWTEHPEGDWWLIVDDGEGFWPVMCRLPRDFVPPIGILPWRLSTMTATDSRTDTWTATARPLVLP